MSTQETEGARIKTTDVKVGDRIGRQANDNGVIWLTVTDVDDDVIHCNRWMFDRLSGAEIDHELGWGPEYGKTGSYITLVKQT